MAPTLDQIVAATRRRVSQDRRSVDVRAIEQRASEHTPRGFRRALRHTAASGIAVIAELKKASPSRGLIREDFDPSTLASELEAAGAAALSVLTDQEFFQGSLENLRLASLSTSLPCLRKDFIVDKSQILEARAHAADAVLLIVAALSQHELLELARHAQEMSLDVLCEVHDEEELKRALDAGCDLIGVNSRDLRTFDVNLNTAVRLGEKMPGGVVVRVAESGIHSGHDIAKLRAVGYDAFLIGESLMKAPSPGETLSNLVKGATAKKVPLV
jgi:indole-3-glycerol phosphate synthase